jgi:hypothetical protein
LIGVDGEKSVQELRRWEGRRLLGTVEFLFLICRGSMQHTWHYERKIPEKISFQCSDVLGAMLEIQQIEDDVRKGDGSAEEKAF